MTDLTLEQALQVINAMNNISKHQTDRARLAPEGMIFGKKGKYMVFHPLTCGNDSNHTPLYPFYEDGKVKLICRDCDYTQENAAMFSVNIND